MEDEQLVDVAFLDAADNQARHVLDAADLQATYDAGMQFMGVCMNGIEPPTRDGLSSEIPVKLYQVWGALTDEVDAPGHGSPEQDKAAVLHMKQAAAGWLEVSRVASRRATYLDHWVHEECGYERPGT